MFMFMYVCALLTNSWITAIIFIQQMAHHSDPLICVLCVYLSTNMAALLTNQQHSKFWVILVNGWHGVRYFILLCYYAPYLKIRQSATLMRNKNIEKSTKNNISLLQICCLTVMEQQFCTTISSEMYVWERFVLDWLAGIAYAERCVSYDMCKY